MLIKALKFSALIFYKPYNFLVVFWLLLFSRSIYC
jgi:hypothetical protein